LQYEKRLSRRHKLHLLHLNLLLHLLLHLLHWHLLHWLHLLVAGYRHLYREALAGAVAGRHHYLHGQPALRRLDLQHCPRCRPLRHGDCHGGSDRRLHLWLRKCRQPAHTRGLLTRLARMALLAVQVRGREGLRGRGWGG
jgi:hypothetical protein